jgi:spermidine synthase
VISDETAPAPAPPVEVPPAAVSGPALQVLVLCAGACSLATEMAGARLLAPYFGTSNVVWANVIGLILVYLSLGYWLGGRLADRHPTPQALGRVVLGAALAIGVLPFATRPLFSAAADAFANVSAGAFVASFLGTMLMFALPVTALGAVSPWAIRLSVTDVREAGTVAGRLYALSTVGSIAGTFLPVLVLIPWIGTQRTLLLAALLLALAALPVASRRALVVPLLLAALLAVPPGLVKAARNGTVLFEGESPYQFVQVVREPSGDVVLHLNEGWAVHSVRPAHGVLTGGYWDAFLALPLLDGRPAGRVAILGNAGGTVANLFAAAWPRSRLDGVELDPLVSDVGRRFLGMRDPNLTVHTADGRFWLASNDGPFDAIVVDAYRQPYIPFHLVSREFFDLVRRRLAPHGVVAINVGTPPRLTAVVRDIAATMRAAFPAVQAARYDDFNSVVVGYRDAADATAAPALLRTASGLPAGPARRLARLLRAVRPGGEVLTDDRAPIEWLTDRALFEYLRAGAPGA